ncbi:MAG: hypothetical protein ACK5NF_05395 [Bacilli bacterium]
MNYVIITEHIEYGKELQGHFECDLYGFLDEIDYDKYEYYILLFDVNKGRCCFDVFDLIYKVNNKQIALVAKGNSGFDINHILKKLCNKNGNLVMYSKYDSNYNYAKISSEIKRKYIRTDGMELSEKFAGFICRLMFRRKSL